MSLFCSFTPCDEIVNGSQIHDMFLSFSLPESDQGGEFTEGQQKTIERNEKLILELTESIKDQVR